MIGAPRCRTSAIAPAILVPEGPVQGGAALSAGAVASDRCAGGYKLFRQWLQASGLPPSVVAEYISGHEQMMVLVATGYGVGFRLESQAALYNHPDIVIRSATDELASASTFMMTNDQPNLPELERFIEQTRRIGEIVRPKEGNALSRNSEHPG